MSAAPTSGAANAENGDNVGISSADWETLLKQHNQGHGLTTADATERLITYGRNESVTAETPAVVVFLLKFTGLSSYLLEIIIIIAAVLGNYLDAGVVGVLLLANAILGFIQDMRARIALDALQQKMQIQTRVRRNNDWVTLSSVEIVPGDVIRLRMGDSNPADCRMMAGECQIDKSALTGESELKSVSDEHHDLIHAGSILRTGECTGLVTATGSKTYFGKTVQLVRDSAPNVHVNRVIRNVSIALLIFVITLLIVALIVTAVRGQNLADIVTLLLVLLVGAIPVALPAMFTVSMAFGSKELIANNVLVTRLNATEDAASMTVLCSDKTGTLTQNSLTVKSCWVLPSVSQILDVSSEEILLAVAGMASRIENHDPIDQAVLTALAKHPKHSKSSKSDSANGSERKVSLNPYSLQADQDLHLIRHLLTTTTSSFESIFFQPFTAATRRTEAVFKTNDDGLIICAKGAAHTLITICNCSPEETSQVLDQIDRNAAAGYRSLAIGVARIDHPTQSYIQQLSAKAANAPGTPLSPHLSTGTDYHLLGVIGLHDPVRLDSAEVIRKIINMGVQVKMLTGDTRSVAVQTAKELRLGLKVYDLHPLKHYIPSNAHPSSPAKNKVQAGKIGHDLNVQRTEEVSIEMAPLSTNAPAQGSPVDIAREEVELMSADIFSDIFPEDKHKIVTVLQHHGHIVGMTGDGVNDAPSLKQAEVGVAVSNATDVAKGASSILINDGLSGILTLITVGRKIHRRVVTWVLNKIAKTILTTVFVVVSFLATGFFPINAFDIVLLLFLIDFVTISLATDNVRVNPKPDRWNVIQLTKVASVVGILSAGECIAIMLVGRYAFNMTEDEVNTWSFELLYFFGIFTTFVVRDDRFAWSSIPSTYLLVITFIESIIVVAICSVGVPSLTSIPFTRAIIVPFIAAGCSFIINDPIKALYFYFNDLQASPLSSIESALQLRESLTVV